MPDVISTAPAGSRLLGDGAGQEIIHQHETRGEQVVGVGEHEATSVVGVARATL